MEGIAKYVLSVLAVAIICGVLRSLFPDKGTFGKLIQLLTGLFMSITIVSALFTLDLTPITSYFDDLTVNANRSVAYGKELSDESLADIIKSQTEAYILDKAASMELNLAVEVTLSESEPPVPQSVELKGSVSPYAKSQLIKWIKNDLGISEDHQTWK